MTLLITSVETQTADGYDRNFHTDLLDNRIQKIRRVPDAGRLVERAGGPCLPQTVKIDDGIVLGL